MSLPRAHFGHNWGYLSLFEGISAQRADRLKAPSDGPLEVVPGVGLEPTRAKGSQDFK